MLSASALMEAPQKEQLNGFEPFGAAAEQEVRAECRYCSRHYERIKGRDILSSRASSMGEQVSSPADVCTSYPSRDKWLHAVAETQATIKGGASLLTHALLQRSPTTPGPTPITPPPMQPPSLGDHAAAPPTSADAAPDSTLPAPEL